MCVYVCVCLCVCYSGIYLCIGRIYNVQFDCVFVITHRAAQCVSFPAFLSHIEDISTFVRRWNTRIRHWC